MAYKRFGAVTRGGKQSLGIIFKIHARNFSEATYNQAIFWEDLEELPGRYVIDNENIRAFYDGEPFQYHTDEWELIESDSVDWETFNFYANLWDDWHHFKQLPNGGGTAGELPWVIDFYKYFDRIYLSIENFRAERARKGLS